MSENVRTDRKAESETRPPAAPHPNDAETAGGVRVDRAHPPIGEAEPWRQTRPRFARCRCAREIDRLRKLRGQINERLSEIDKRIEKLGKGEDPHADTDDEKKDDAGSAYKRNSG